GGEPLRRRPRPHVPGLRRPAGLEDRDAVQPAVRHGRLQGGHLPDQGQRRVEPAEARGRAPPGAAGAGDREPGPHPHQRRHRRRPPRGRGGRRHHRPRRPPDRRLPFHRPGRAVGQHHRLGGADHPPAVGHRRRLPGREEPAPEQGQGDADSPGPPPPGRAAAPGRRALQRPSGPGRRRRPVGEDPDVQLQGEPGHRPPRRPHRPQPRPGAGRRPRPAARRPRRGRPGGPACRSGQLTTWRDLHAAAAAGTSEVDARWRGEELSGLDRSRWTEPVPPGAADRLGTLVARRSAGEPLQYVLGRWAFRGPELHVDPRVLIPRPETEVVAGLAIEEARRGGGPCTVADLGTGSGAIALSLAAEVPAALVWATDVSPAALEVARANLAAVAPEAAARVRLAEGMWYEALPGRLRGRLRVIVSNPPYVTAAEFTGLPPEVRDHEPVGALVSGPTGLECLEHLIAGGGRWLEPGGALVLEMAPDQAAPLCRAAAAAGYEAVAVHRDLAGRQ